MNENIIGVDSYDFEERIQSGVVLVYFYEHLNVESRVLEPIIGLQKIILKMLRFWRLIWSSRPILLCIMR